MKKTDLLERAFVIGYSLVFISGLTSIIIHGNSTYDKSFKLNPDSQFSSVCHYNSRDLSEIVCGQLGGPHSCYYDRDKDGTYDDATIIIGSPKHGVYKGSKEISDSIQEALQKGVRNSKQTDQNIF